MRKADWYFDFISPFAYLQFSQLNALKPRLDISLKPVLFAGLLQHWGQLGPAEIPTKRTFTYRYAQWRAQQRGLNFKTPPHHPFNPLPALRLALATENHFRAVALIFDYIWGQGNTIEDEAIIVTLGRAIGLEDPLAAITAETTKTALREATDTAIATGVFGVPTFAIDGELFWGDDATEMVGDFLDDPHLFKTTEMQRLTNLPIGQARTHPRRK